MTSPTANASSSSHVFVAVRVGLIGTLKSDMAAACARAGLMGPAEETFTTLSENGDLAACECSLSTAQAEILSASLVDTPPDYDYALLPAEDRRKRLLISDMDSTIIQQECLDELAAFAGLKAKISAITERAMAGELDFDAALTERVAMLAGLDLSALQECYEKSITLMPGAETLVATMTANGARCVLVSGGFTFFTQRVAAAAGFHAHRGNTLIDDGAKLTGAVGRPILGREAKQTALEEECAARDLNVSEAVAMGDGANDLAMICAAGLGIAYRAKPIVAAEADAAITHTDLRAALYFQGYAESEFSS